ncbi:MAG: DMT family transporter [Anaerolineae bacterium]
MKDSNLKMGFSEWSLLLFLALLWGSSFLLMKVAVQELPVFTVVLGRVGIAALVMTVYVFAKGLAMPTSFKEWGQLFLLGFLRAGLPISLFVWAGTQIDSSVSGILNSTTPLFTVLVAHFLTQDEKLTSNKLLGIIAGMVGVVFLIGPNALQGLGNNVLGQMAVLGATLSYGFAGVYGRRFKHMPVAVSTAGLLIGSTLMILPIALFLDQPWLLRPSLIATGSVVALAVFNTGIAFMVWLTLVLKVGATNTSQVTIIIPVVALILGFIVLQEAIEWNAVVGLGFILLGLAISQNRLKLNFATLAGTN